VLRRVARALRDQGEFNSAVIAYRATVDQAPLDPSLLDSRLEIVDLYQNRILEPGRAQEARLLLAESTAPASPWGRANMARAADAAKAREMGDRGRERAVQHFGWSVVAQKTVDVYLAAGAVPGALAP
jgi:hypothetical protein